MIALVEVWGPGGAPVWRFEEFLADSVRFSGVGWPRLEAEAMEALQAHATGRARGAILSETLGELHGHRFDLQG